MSSRTGRCLRIAAACLALAGCDVFDRELVAPEKLAEDASLPVECTPRHAPERPVVERESPSIDARWFVLRDLDLAPGPAWMTQGLDLDSRCTTDVSDQASCRTGTAAALDGEDGIDNAFGAFVLPALANVDPDLPAEARRSHALGRGALAIRLREWNGEDDDPHVEVAIALSAFAVPSDDGSRPRPAANGQPRWDGRDHVWLRRDSFLDGRGESAKLGDADAYVRDRTLVMQLPHRAPLTFATSRRTFTLPLEHAVLLARLSRDGDSVIDATLVAQVGAVDVIDALPAIGICETSEHHEAITRLVTRAADLPSFDENETCSHLGLAIEMTGYPVRFGGITGARPLPSPCRGATPRQGDPGEVGE